MNINATLFAQIIVFFGLVWFTMKFVYSPIAKALDERAAKIAEGLAAAERGKSDFEQAEKRLQNFWQKGVIRFPKWLPTPKNVPPKLSKKPKNRLLPRRRALQLRQRPMWSRNCSAHANPCAIRLPCWLSKVIESILRSEVDASKHAKLLDTLKQEL